MKTILSTIAFVAVATVAIVNPAWGAEASTTSTVCPAGTTKVRGPSTIETDSKGRAVIITPYVCK